MYSIEMIRRINREAEAKRKPELAQKLARDLLNLAYVQGFDAPTLEEFNGRVVIKDALTGEILLPNVH